MHVLIASDGSEVSIEAARRASALLHSADRVTLLIAIDRVPGDESVGFSNIGFAPDEQERLWNTEYAHVRDAVAHAATALTDVPIDKRIETGHPATTICDVAREVNADVIVLGSHGHTGVRRFVLGSVSEHVVRHAPCPVLVVHAAGPEASPDDGEHGSRP